MDNKKMIKVLIPIFIMITCIIIVGFKALTSPKKTYDSTQGQLIVDITDRMNNVEIQDKIAEQVVEIAKLDNSKPALQKFRQGTVIKDIKSLTTYYNLFNASSIKAFIKLKNGEEVAITPDNKLGITLTGDIYEKFKPIDYIVNIQFKKEEVYKFFVFKKRTYVDCIRVVLVQQ